MKIKIIKKIEIIGYEVKMKVELFEKEVKDWSFGSVMGVCGCNDEDGMGWEVMCFNEDVMVIGNVDGDVEFVVVKE